MPLHIIPVFLNVYSSDPQIGKIFIVRKNAIVAQSFWIGSPLAAHILKLYEAADYRLRHTCEVHPYKTHGFEIVDVARFTGKIGVIQVFDRNSEKPPLGSSVVNPVNHIVFSHLQIRRIQIDFITVVGIQIAQGIILVDVFHIRNGLIAWCVKTVSTCG